MQKNGQIPKMEDDWENKLHQMNSLIGTFYV